MIVCKYFVEFAVYSFLGWIYECIYCSIKEKKWANRGFLYGPVCPIYGFGAIICEVIFSSNFVTISGKIPVWEIFVICAFGSAVLEYFTSYILEKRFHALWWDYYDFPFNINGRICLPVTCCFGLAGIVVVKFVFPFAQAVKADMNPYFAEVVAILIAGFMAADTALAIQSLVDLTGRLDAIEKEFNRLVQGGYEAASDIPREVRERFAGMLSERQRYALSNMKHYTAGATSSIANRLRVYVKDLSGRSSKKSRREEEARWHEQDELERNSDQKQA